MPELGTMLVVAVSGLLFSLSPGPSMLYVLSRSMGQGRSAGLASAVGLALGGVALALLTALGAGWVVADSETSFRIVKLLGGLYLLWLGAGMLKSAREARIGSVPEVAALPFGRIVWQGFLVEVLNPKTILFFLAFLPAFVDTDAGSIQLQMLVLGALVPLTALPADVSVSVAGAWIAKRLGEHTAVGWALAFVGGLVVTALGLRTLLTLL